MTEEIAVFGTWMMGAMVSGSLVLTESCMTGDHELSIRGRRFFNK
jgi:hypothetical protein